MKNFIHLLNSVEDFKRIVLLCNEKGIDFKTLEGLIENYQPKEELKTSTSIDTITVKSSLTLEQRIANGKYGWKNDSITESNFPHDPITIGDWEFRLIHPNRNISSEKAKALCGEDGWQAAKLEHLLAFGEAFPEKQKEFPIVALGSVCRLDDYRLVAKLWCLDDERELLLRYWVGDWDAGYRFLSVRKISAS